MDRGGPWRTFALCMWVSRKLVCGHCCAASIAPADSHPSPNYETANNVKPGGPVVCYERPKQSGSPNPMEAQQARPLPSNTGPGVYAFAPGRGSGRSISRAWRLADFSMASESGSVRLLPFSQGLCFRESTGSGKGRLRCGDLARVEEAPTLPWRLIWGRRPLGLQANTAFPLAFCGRIFSGLTACSR